MAAITGAIAEVFYGIPDGLWEQAKVFMDDGGLADTVERFYRMYRTDKEQVMSVAVCTWTKGSPFVVCCKIN